MIKVTLTNEIMNRILEIEDNHAKKADHHYSIFGAFINSLLAVSSSLLTIMVVVFAFPLLKEVFVGLSGLLSSYYIPANIYNAIDTQALLMPAIAATLPLFLGVIRHKKSRSSNVLSVLFGILVTLLFTIIL